MEVELNMSFLVPKFFLPYAFYEVVSKSFEDQWMEAEIRGLVMTEHCVVLWKFLTQNYGPFMNE